MAVIWGMDLRDMKWSNFKSSYMFGNTDYHMRRTKFIIYQLAMIFLIVSESLGTAVLSDYIDQQNTLQHRFPGITVFNNDFVGIASYNIFVGIFAAFVFGAAFFFDLFFPERYEPRWVQNLWMGCAIFTCLAATGDALGYTIILCLRGEQINYVNSDDPQLQQDINRARNSTPILYRNSGRAIASVVFLWLGWACSIARYVNILNDLVLFTNLG